MSKRVMAIAMVIGALQVACGSVTPLGTDGSAGQGGAGQGGAGQGGAGQGGAGDGGADSSADAAAMDAPCPGVACILPCAMVSTLEACELRTDCHSVFVDPGTCGCAAVGCCAHFSRCADGDKAKCAGMPMCRVATPFCEGQFVVAYTETCYDGCVNKKDCAP